MRTLGALIDRHGVDVLGHLDRQVTVPVLAGLQAQGDVLVLPHTGRAATTPLHDDGVPVVRGESGGNTHLLLADGPVCFDSDPAGLRLGVLTVADGAAAYLAHPEHGYLGIAPGSYELRRQREQTDVVRLVAD